LLLRRNSRKQAAATAEQQGNRPSQQAKAERAERRGRRQPTKGRLAGQRKIATVSQFGCGDTSEAQLLCTEALALIRGKLCGRGKNNERKA